MKKPGGACHRAYRSKAILTLHPIYPEGIQGAALRNRIEVGCLAIAVAPMAPNLSLRSRPAVTGSPIQPPMPDHTDTYCLPFTEYVIGLPMIPEPSLRDHSTLPVALSTARKSPPKLP